MVNSDLVFVKLLNEVHFLPYTSYSTPPTHLSACQRKVLKKVKFATSLTSTVSVLEGWWGCGERKPEKVTTDNYRLDTHTHTHNVQSG